MEWICEVKKNGGVSVFFERELSSPSPVGAVDSEFKPRKHPSPFVSRVKNGDQAEAVVAFHL